MIRITWLQHSTSSQYYSNEDIHDYICLRVLKSAFEVNLTAQKVIQIRKHQSPLLCGSSFGLWIFRIPWIYSWDSLRGFLIRFQQISTDYWTVRQRFIFRLFKCWMVFRFLYLAWVGATHSFGQGTANSKIHQERIFIDMLTRWQRKMLSLIKDLSEPERLRYSRIYLHLHWNEIFIIKYLHLSMLNYYIKSNISV